MQKSFDNFWNFFPFYLSQHQNKTNQKLHLIGTLLVSLSILIAFFTLNPIMFLLAPVSGYSFAWIGHFFFEKNKPATFKNPIYSLYGDYVMAYYNITGQLDRQMKEALKKLDSEKAPSYSPYGMRVEKVF